MNKKAGNAAHMKFVNRKTVINIIRENPISRADLARKTGLTRAAVTMIVDGLIQEGLVLETGVSRTGAGRNPIILEINPDRYYALSLDLSRTGCHLGLVDLLGKVLMKQSIGINAFLHPMEAVDSFAENLQKIVSTSGIQKDKLLGLGVSSPGPVDTQKGIILNPPNFAMWHYFNIVEVLTEKLRMPVMLKNISGARAIAEKRYGAGKCFKHFILLVVDDGVGAGIFLNEKLYHGTGGYGSELGHMSLQWDGEICDCGNRGCLETFASIPQILKEAKKHVPSIVSWKELVDRAEAGDKICRQMIEKESVYLGTGIVNAVNLFEPEAIILAGDILYKPELLLGKITEMVSRVSITGNLRPIMILPSSILENSCIISPASVMIENFFSL